MADETELTQTDILQTQKKMIDTLVNVLLQGGQQGQVVYAQPAQQQTAAPNYLLWIGLGLGLFLFFKFKK